LSFEILDSLSQVMDYINGSQPFSTRVPLNRNKLTQVPLCKMLEGILWHSVAFSFLTLYFWRTPPDLARNPVGTLFSGWESLFYMISYSLSEILNVFRLNLHDSCPLRDHSNIQRHSRVGVGGSKK